MELSKFGPKYIVMSFEAYQYNNFAKTEGTKFLLLFVTDSVITQLAVLLAPFSLLLKPENITYCSQPIIFLDGIKSSCQFTVEFDSSVCICTYLFTHTPPFCY